jgi:single-strand DNA-binding protein
MDINTVTLVGRLTADPELRTTNGGTPVCTLRMASNRAPKDGNDQGAVFIDVVSFNRLAEAVAENLAKGRQVAVSGRIEFRQWEAEDGSARSKHYIIANQVQFLAKPAANGAPPEPAYDPGEEPF